MTAHPASDPLGTAGPSLDLPPEVALSLLSAGNGRGTRRWRGLLTWSATSAPVALLLTAGIALGPHGINLLSPAALTSLDPVMPVALAALGVLVAMMVIDHRTDDRRVLAASCLAALVTALVVSAGFGAVAAGTTSPTGRPFWVLILASGLCAATSLTLPSDDALQARLPARRVIELGVLLPIVASAVLLAWLRAGSPAAALVLVAQACGITLALAAAAWLLVTRATSDTEERVLAVAALLLVGGAAAALSLSAIFGGLVAGLFWRYAGWRQREAIRRDAMFVQHPLLVLVLLVAGARADPSSSALVLGLGYVMLRVAARLAAGWLTRRVAGGKAPRDLGLHLLPAGVFGVGFALNAFSVVGADASMLLAAVVIGTIGSEVVAALLSPRSAE